MKKVTGTFALILALVMFAGTVMGCISHGKIVTPDEWAGDLLFDAFVTVGEGIGNAVHDAKTKNEFARQRSANPLDSPVEDRLTRRTSTLAGGIPVDISPYLLHDYSIAVTETGIQRSGSVVKISGVEGTLYELDVVLVFKAEKQSRQMNVTATVCADKVNEQIKQSMKKFAARRLGLKPEKIQNFQVQLLNTRRGNSDYRFEFDNVFIQETEPGYFQFDVEVEYQKQEVKKEKTQPEHFAVFNQVYHTDLMSEAGAAIEMQAVMWNAARESSVLKRETPFPVINVVRAVKVSETTDTRNKRIAKEKTDRFSKGGDSPFANAAEDRLTRRTSTLAGGITVDVSPYLLHGNSFAVTEKGIQHYRSVLESVTRNYCYLFEFDAALAFEADKQKYQMNATIALCASAEKEAQKQAEKYMQQHTAQWFGLDPKTIKNFKVKFLKTRKGKSTLDFRFDNVFVHDIEPGHFQFDVEVEYQKWKTAFTGADTKVTPDIFTVFNQVYRSDFTSVEAAALDAQTAIWNDARKKGFNETPLPVINFVKAVRMQ